MAEHVVRVDALAALAGKYGVLCALRRQSDAALARGCVRIDGEARRSRDARLLRLASRFPGSLRELARLDLGTLLERRRQAVHAVRVLGGPAPAGPAARPELARWIAPMLAYHATLSDGLHLQRRLRADPELATSALVSHLRHWYAPAGEGALSFLDAAGLAAYRRPPDGRLSALVVAQLAPRFGLSPAALTALLFERSR